ncbi:MAG: DUF3035 domain-containing protein [Pseudomonadota bacterium]
MNHKHIAYIFAVLTLGVLTACSGTKEKLGLDKKKAPDEFAVVKRAPLSMPPGFQLDPPKPGAARPQERTPDEDAKQTVFGKPVVKPKAPSSTEALFLQQAGSEIAQDGIRKTVDSETTEYDGSDKPVIDRLLSFTDGDELPGTVVDAEKELERLKKNKEEGKPLSTGETPSIEN